MKHTIEKKHLHSTYLVYIVTIFVFASIAVFGPSLFTLNNRLSTAGMAFASAQEPADINNDNVVNIFDLSTLLSKWNTTDTTSDLNEDGTVNIFDLSILLSKWGVVGSGGTGVLNLPRIPWEGGSNYWKVSNGAQFAKADAAGWDDPSFFPISVFLSKADPSHVTSLKDAGINLYMGVEHSPEIFPLTNITSQGLYAMPHQEEWTPAEVGSNAGAVAWFSSDECDMGYGGCSGDEYNQLSQQQAYVNKIRGYSDGRFVHANFGNGILRTFWSPNTIDDHVQLMDSASADKYTYTSPDVASIIDGGHDAPDWPNGVPVARAYSYGWQADQMKRFQATDSLRPIWTFIETAKPYLGESGALTIQPDQIEGAVWSALIHEARGIAYFQHNNNGVCGNYSIVECADVHTKVKAINATVKSLAPVLNTQSYYNTTETVNGYTYYRYRFNNGTDTMLKTYNGSVYIFAALGMHCNNSSCTSGTVDSTGAKAFMLPVGITGTTVEVVGEDRTIPVTNGQFTDTFSSEYTHHIYKVAF